MTRPAWSVVIPAYNEVERLPRSLDEVFGFFDGRGLSYEVLVMDDCSTDGTPDLVRVVSRLHPEVRLEAALAAGADIAIGPRGIVDPGVCVRARRHRVVAGRLFNWTVSRLGLKSIADSQCGFKTFTAAAAEDGVPWDGPPCRS